MTIENVEKIIDEADYELIVIKFTHYWEFRDIRSKNVKEDIKYEFETKGLHPTETHEYFKFSEEKRTIVSLAKIDYIDKEVK